MNSQPLLIVIDVQNGFVNQHSSHVLPVIRRLLGEWTAMGREVLFTRYHNYDN